MARSRFQFYDDPEDLASFVVRQARLRSLEITNRYGDPSIRLELDELQHVIAEDSPRSTFIELAPTRNVNAGDAYGVATVVFGVRVGDSLIESSYGAHWDEDDADSKRCWMGIRRDLRNRSEVGGTGTSADGKPFEAKVFYTESALKLYENGYVWRQVPGGIPFRPSD